MKEKTDDDNLSPAAFKFYSIKMAEELFERIDKLICHLKHVDNHSQTKQRWIINAIKEHLNKEVQPDLPQSLRIKAISIRVDAHLEKKMDKIVKDVKKTTRGYSKKQLIMEAIVAQLENSEKKDASISGSDA